MRARVLTLFTAVTLTAGAAQAQGLSPGLDVEMRAVELRALQDMADRRAVIQRNELMMLDAQLRTQQALADVRAQNQRPMLAPPPQTGVMPKIDTGQLASIPDSKLEASNAAVRAAAANRR